MYMRWLVFFAAPFATCSSTITSVSHKDDRTTQPLIKTYTAITYDPYEFIRDAIQSTYLSVDIADACTFTPITNSEKFGKITINTLPQNENNFTIDIQGLHGSSFITVTSNDSGTHIYCQHYHKSLGSYVVARSLPSQRHLYSLGLENTHHSIDTTSTQLFPNYQAYIHNDAKLLDDFLTSVFKNDTVLLPYPFKNHKVLLYYIPPSTHTPIQIHISSFENPSFDFVLNLSAQYCEHGFAVKSSSFPLLKSIRKKSDKIPNSALCARDTLQSKIETLLNNIVQQGTKWDSHLKPTLKPLAVTSARENRVFGFLINTEAHSPVSFLSPAELKATAGQPVTSDFGFDCDMLIEGTKTTTTIDDGSVPLVSFLKYKFKCTDLVNNLLRSDDFLYTRPGLHYNIKKPEEKTIRQNITTLQLARDSHVLKGTGAIFFKVNSISEFNKWISADGKLLKQDCILVDEIPENTLLFVSFPRSRGNTQTLALDLIVIYNLQSDQAEEEDDGMTFVAKRASIRLVARSDEDRMHVYLTCPGSFSAFGFDPGRYLSGEWSSDHAVYRVSRQYLYLFNLASIHSIISPRHNVNNVQLWDLEAYFHEYTENPSIQPVLKQIDGFEYDDALLESYILPLSSIASEPKGCFTPTMRVVTGDTFCLWRISIKIAFVLILVHGLYRHITDHDKHEFELDFQDGHYYAYQEGGNLASDDGSTSIIEMEEP